MKYKQKNKLNYDENTMVTLPNSLLSARYNMNKRAHQLCLMAMSQLNEFSYILGISHAIEVTAKDWQEVNIESENPYRDLKIALRELATCEIKFKNDQHSYKFLEKAEYQDKQGKVLFCFAEDFLIACYQHNIYLPSETNID